jgi:iron complex outermembrane receptor protein
MHRLPAVLAILACSASWSLFAQGLVKGKVFDKGTQEPLYGVYITTGNNEGTTTGIDGLYSLKIQGEKAVISIRFIGYKTFTHSVSLSGTDTLILNAGLETDIREIGQIVVSANRTEQKIAELSVSMEVLRSVDFLKNHITDPQELVNKSSGIEIMDGQASVRGGSGFSYGAGSRVLALIDGLPVISPDAGSIKWQFLPLENIEQVEIIKGASSVLYGSSALNGIINFRTADATTTPQTKFYAETGVYGSPRNEKWIWWNSPRLNSSLSFSHLMKSGKTDVGIGLNLLYDEGYRKFNDEKLGRLSLKLKHHNEKIKGLVYGLNINSGYTVKRDFVLWEDATSGALKQDTSTVSLLHGSYLAVDPFITLRQGGKVTHTLRGRLQLADNRFPIRTQNNSDAYLYYSEYQLNYKFSDKTALTAGLTESFISVISEFYGDHKGLDVAGFAEIDFTPVPRLKLVGGIRLEQNSLDKTRDRLVPIFRTGLNWQAAEYTFLRASFGQGYRYPSIAEKFASTSLGTVRIFPNPYVEPESGWSAEAGLKQGILSGEITGQADLALFISQNANMIEYLFGNYPDPVTEVFSYGFMATNVEYSRVYGSELEVALNRNFGKIRTTLKGGYTYIYPVEFNKTTGKNTDTYLKYRRKHSAVMNLNASLKRFELGCSLFLRSKILRIDDVFLNEMTREQILPGFYDYWQNHNKGYFTMDGNFAYSISSALSLSLVVRNITNTEYLGRPGDIQPQRSYSIRFSGNF